MDRFDPQSIEIEWSEDRKIQYELALSLLSLVDDDSSLAAHVISHLLSTVKYAFTNLLISQWQSCLSVGDGKPEKRHYLNYAMQVEYTLNQWLIHSAIVYKAAKEMGIKDEDFPSEFWEKEPEWFSRRKKSIKEAIKLLEKD